MLNTVIELNGKYSDWLGCHAHHFLVNPCIRNHE